MRLFGRFYLSHFGILLAPPTGHSFRPLLTRRNAHRQLLLRRTTFAAVREDLEQLTVPLLKDRLRTQGLKVSGRKSELIDRLLESSISVKGEPAEKGKAVPSKKAEKEATPKKKNASNDHQRITERVEIPKLWDSEKALANGSYTFKIVSWNVAGLRGMLKKQPTALKCLAKEMDFDMLCLQETKLQEMHLDDPKLNLRALLKEDGYDDYWSCSTARKGYSGTAVFVKHREITSAPELPISVKNLIATDVSFKIGKEIDNEGRTVVVKFPWATIVNVYVPNSGQGLKRLDYRVEQWDKDFLEFMQGKHDRGPVIWLGDLNVAHKAADVWNDGAKHLENQAGVTSVERASFQAQLDAGFVDAFRKLHPTATGHYSYWSQRAGNRSPNKGLRLDYFICSSGLFSEQSKVIVRDSYILKDQMGSDHCPVVLELEMRS